MNVSPSIFIKSICIVFLLYIEVNASCYCNTASPPPPPINDECSGAIAIVASTSCVFHTYSSIGATASLGAPSPGCAGYVGGDVWFKVVVPPSGHLIFDSYNEGIGSSGMAIYSGSCGSLTLIACDAHSNINFMPMIERTGLVPGTTIYIRFWKDSYTSGGAFDLCVYEPIIPINDDCMGAITIIPDTVCSYTTYSNLHATSSVGIPSPGCANYLGSDVWFKVVVPPSGHLIIDSQNSGSINGDGGMAIYTGSCGSLNLLSCNDNGSDNPSMPLINQYGLIPGATIYIRFWRNGNLVGWSFGLCVYDPPVPINDECSGAIPLSVDTICTYASYTNAGATASIGIPQPGCANYIDADVWFSVVVPPSGRLIFDSQNQGIVNGGMAIYSGSCGALSLIACNDNSSDNALMPLINQSGLSPGTTIYIRFWRNYSSNGGRFGLCVYNPPIPVNDECSAAIAIIPGNSCSYSNYTNIGASASQGIPAPGCANYIGGDVWFKVIVPVSGHLIFDLKNNSSFNADGGMAIYSGNCGSLSLISCNDNSSNNALMPLINQYGLTPDSTVFIRIWRNNNITGWNFGLCVYNPPIPINDNCSGSIPLTIDSICSFTTYTTIGATASAGVPSPGCANYVGADVWFSAVVPASGRLIFDSKNEGIVNGGMAIYSGNCNSLTLIACDDNSSSNPGMPLINRSGLTPDSTIFIRFWENGSATGGAFDLCVYDPPMPSNDDCSGAILIVPDSICNFTTYSNVGATASIGVSAPGCANYTGGDVWFKVVVPASGRLIFDSQDEGIGLSGMAIYSGNCGSLAYIACDNYSNINSMPTINQTDLTPDSTIYIRFWQNNFTPGGAFGLCVYDPPIPVNDECAGAIMLSPDTVCSFTVYSTVGATASSNLPLPTCANYIGGDVWFSVVVPASGRLIFDSQHLGLAAGDGGMAIYSGSCGALTLIACNDNSSNNALMPLINQTGLTPGSTIFIRIWNNNSLYGFEFGLCVYDPMVPINDECSGAIAITPGTTCSYSTFSNVYATASSGVPSPGCANYIGTDVWFSVVVPPSGHLIFDSQNNSSVSGDGGMTIYSGSCGSLSLIACNDNSSNYPLMPMINKSGLTPGTTIYIRFWRNNNLNGWTFGLCVYDPPIPINDDCSGAISIIPDTVCVYTTYTNAGATASAGVPAPGCAAYIGADVWFKVVVPASGILIFDSQNQGIVNGGMAIYSGNCGALTLIACDDNSSNNTAMPMIYQSGLTPDSTIYIRFWRNNNITGGAFGLSVYYPPPTPIQPPCNNLGFENGLTGWYGTSGNPVSGLTNAPTPVYVPQVFNSTSGLNFAIMTMGTDPYGGFPKVFSGTKSLRLGNAATDEEYNAASIEQTFQVTEANTNFTYHYAVVFQNSNHTYNIQPFFKIELYDPNGNLIPCGIYSVALPNASFIQSPLNSSVYYKPWTPISINLSAYIGQSVKIRFTSADCVPGAHFGYAYLDCSCQPYEIIAPDTICLGQSATLTAPAGALSYQWSPGGETSSSISVSPTTSTNYSCLISTQGNTPCFYTLNTTVGVVSETSPTAGSNSPLCSGEGLQLTSFATSANTYHWSGPDGFVSTLQNPLINTVSMAASGTYTLTSSINGGCVGVDSVSVIVFPTIQHFLNPSICQGESFSVGTHSYSNSGIYLDTMSTSLGCDSIITTNLTVHPITQTTLNPVICNGETYSIGTHNYAISGTYQDTLLSSFGCDSLLTIHLTVQEKQQMTLNPAICQGDTFHIGTHFYATTGTYTDTLLNASGCDSIVITNLVVHPIPPAPVVIQNGNVLSSNTATGNQWYNQNGMIPGANQQTYTATIEGDYYDIVTINGCPSDTSNIRHVFIFILHLANVGLDEFEEPGAISIYPNPASDEITIEAKGNNEKIGFEIINPIGQMIFEGSFMEKTIVQTKNFSQGVYMLKLIRRNGIELKKVVKE
ncbi:MAG: T9SS type A sorting domain-containing protein [Bacteroidota bacterium]